MKKLNIKIKKAPQALPNMAYGGQRNYSLDVNSKYYDNLSGDDNKISTTLQPVPRDQANIEAELNETIVADFDNDGIKEHMKVGGKRHSKGGTPLSVPGEAFVFSDTKKMKIGGETLVSFGKSESAKKKYTPAELAKQYDINKYKAILDDKNADPVSKRTAELMINNYEQKLGKLALVQEAMKGFPTGIPQIAMPYMMAQPGMGESDDSMMSEQPFFAKGGELPVYAFAGEVDMFGNPIDPYKGDKLTTKNPKTGQKEQGWNKSKYTNEEWKALRSGLGYTGPDDNKKFQQFIYDKFPDIVDKYHSTEPVGYGLPSVTGKKIDGLLGVRWDAIAEEALKRNKKPSPPQLSHTFVPKIESPNNVKTSVYSELEPNKAFYIQQDPEEGTYWTQDKINVASAMQNRLNLKKYMPWEAPVNAVTADPTFYDPNRELASNAEQMNTQMMYNSQFAGPQSLGARNSAVAGQAAVNAADIMSRTNNQNVGVANQFAGINADITNRLLQAQGERVNRLYNNNVIANQQFDNSKFQANDVIRKNLLSALSNKQKTQWFNTWYPQYNIDASTGMINFNNQGYHGITPGSGSSKTYIEIYNQLKKENPNVPDDIIKEQVKQIQGNARNTVDNEGNVKSTSRGEIPPALQTFLQSFNF